MSTVPDFHAASAPRAPFPPGEVPPAGWFCIETTFRHPSPRPDGLARGLGYELPPGVDAAEFAAARGFADEVATAETLALLEKNFNRFDSGGRGLLVTRDHASFNSDVDTRATGWIKALHAEPDALWAWIEWTPFGHAMIDGGEFVHFSTEYDYGDFELTADGAQPTRLAACTVTNEPRHGGQIPCTNALRAGRIASHSHLRFTNDDLRFRNNGGFAARQQKEQCLIDRQETCTASAVPNSANRKSYIVNRKSAESLSPMGQNQTTTMRTYHTPTRRSRNSDEPEEARAANADERPQPGDTPTAANSDEPEEARAANADEKPQPGDTPAAANSDDAPPQPQQQERAAANEDGLDLESCCQQAAELLGLPESATPEDLLAAIRSLIHSNQELHDALAEANTAANAATCRNGAPRFRFLTARNSSRLALRGQVPNHAVQVRVGSGIRAVNTQAKCKADFCAHAVAERERSLGRRLTPSEYGATYNEAMRNYNDGLNR